VAAVEHHPTLSSTQDRATAMATACPAERLPLLVIADRQTAGRGRGRNSWWTGEGSLAFSLVCDPAAWGLARPTMPACSLAVGVALVDTLAPELPAKPIGLHWPNDVYADGRKLAGILLDVLVDGRWVLGVGINTNNRFDGAPPEVRERAASIYELSGKATDHASLLIRFLSNLESSMCRLPAGPPLTARFQELCLQIGRTLTIEIGNQRVTGRCEGIAEDGALLLATPSGLQRHYCGVLR